MKSGKSLLYYLLIIIVIALFLLWVWLYHFSMPQSLDWDPQRIVEVVKHSGMAGPLVIIAAIATAIVFSPLPSAPIAMAAGAIYGHFEGTIYVFVGSLIGASAAFGVARVLGLQAAHAWLDQRFPDWKLGDQKRLMWLVMVTRLMPFMSFDLVSYVAGVTVLSYGRFLLATAVGILPACFLLAYLGEAAIEQSFTLNVVVVIGLLIAAGIWHLRSDKNS
ncbi:TVP38/TMEM64 family protein [Photobacterium alginatilyticum]|uniref:TVP38/TMEM64 family membrane protein n=1 Tax=Photobacterium alginatilyticum TaxID=1775171 RepID=A0ABW9YK54_9GAMM|nr:TVP38/TMEM64 family protein [Photobacterium alginatilyticum]NBI54192.1 TVP38/TMEM64 family protein [Photobacterium alginatilyticum]